ncbi:MAG: SpoIIE family protein phosphatase [Nocardioidaceae bacterium]|nr:SpoIIE family protein phosphatase [Nocardioidaceae bacterium]MCL2613765.1 SpoIIE family protein phosphatase [Nocardioidaceae bacterium]
MPTTPTDVQVPATVPVLPGTAVSARYLLTRTAPINRGDTLEAYRLDDGRVAAMVADVVGHGFAAAIAATQVRTVLRERLTSGADLGEAVAALDRFARGTPDLAAATLTAVVLDPVRSTVEYVAAGHPPPVRWSDRDQPACLEGARCPPLGSGGPVTTATAPAGLSTSLLLHSDGLTAGGPAGSDPISRIVAATDSLRGTPRDAVSYGDELCDQLLDPPAEGAAAYPDDVALLLLRRVRAPEPLDLRLAADATSVAAVRRHLSTWLEDLGAGLSDQVALCHAAGELASNVVEHAYADSAAPSSRVLDLRAWLEPGGRAVVEIADGGRWVRTGTPGRGLLLAAALVDDIRMHSSEAGSIVELCQELHRPVPFLQAGSGPADVGHLDTGEDLHLDTTPGRLVAVGAVDDVNAEMFEAGLREATRTGTVEAVIDLSGLTLLASPGVQALLDLIGRSRRSGSPLRLIAELGSPADQVLRLIDVPHQV